MDLSRLRSLCQALGGGLVEMTEEEFDRTFMVGSQKEPVGLTHAPFTDRNLGVDWEGKRVLYSTRWGVHWPDLIHEMAHIFASVVSPAKSDEWSFFGWEYAMCLYLGGDLGVWKEAQQSYLPPTKVALKAFGSLSSEQQQAILDERLAAAKAAGLVAEDGTPLAIR